MLAALLAGYHSEARGQVYQPDAALGRVLVLPTGSARTKSLHAALGEELIVRVGNLQVWVGITVHCRAGLELWHHFTDLGSV